VTIAGIAIVWIVAYLVAIWSEWKEKRRE